MKNYQLSILSLFLILPFFINAQSNNEPFFHKDTSLHSINDFFKKSKVSGHIRNHFMGTINQGELKNYWTNATGGLIKIETPEWNGLQLGVAGIFTFQTISPDLNEIDPISGKSAKWEKELYDINRPTITSDFDRLEELYLKYNFGHSLIQYGKIDLNKGPLFKKRDGRMKAFVYQGLWAEINEWDNQKITLGWINGVSPRGMTEWFSINEAIGMNNNGFHTADQKANYHETAESKGIGVVGYKNQLANGLTVQYWNFLFHNLFDMNWLQMDYKKKHFFTGIQYVYQRASSHQMDLEENKRYIQPNEKAHVMSLQAGYKKSGFSASMAYLHSFNTGRFLFPRELGREDFYVSQPRSWIDGFGNLDVFMLRLKYRPLAPKWKNLSLDARLSQTIISEKDDPTFNKYKLPSFYQITFLAKYKAIKRLKGLEFNLLYVNKHSPESEGLTIAQKFYRSDFHHFSFITNIKF